jgi:hypothetical protein
VVDKVIAADHGLGTQIMPHDAVIAGANTSERHDSVTGK